MRPLLVFFLFILPGINADAQLLQHIRGQVIDKDTHSPLEGVIVSVTSLPAQRITATDSVGRFVLDSIPVGKQDLVYGNVAGGVITACLCVISGVGRAHVAYFDEGSMTFPHIKVEGEPGALIRIKILH